MFYCINFAAVEIYRNRDVVCFEYNFYRKNGIYLCFL